MTLIDYTKEKGISIRQLSMIVGVSYPQLYNIARDRNYNATLKTMYRIAGGTMEEFGKPLLPRDYLNVNALLGEV